MTGTVPDFAPLYIRDYPRLVSYLRGKLPTREDAEDVAQVAFLRLWRNHAHVAELRAYLWRSARNLVVDFYRQAIPVAELGEWSAAYDVKMDAMILAEWALGELIPQERHDTLMRYLGYTQQEIADARGVTVHAVNHSLVRGRARLRRRTL